MGVRHAQGLLSCDFVRSVEISDSNPDALSRAQADLQRNEHFLKCSFRDSESVFTQSAKVDVVVVATTAMGRLGTLQKVYQLKPQVVLVEKPLGQSFQEVTDLVDLANSHPVKTFSNLNMRLYDYFKALREDLISVPQLAGFKNVTINSGAVGIGANGIHYIDLLVYLFGAASVTVERAFVEDDLIASGRGAQFSDFGGYACFLFLAASGAPLGRALVAIHATSSVLGAWEVVAPNARVRIDEICQKRYNHYRRPESQLPPYRYGADYFEEEVTSIKIPEMADLTKQWLEAFVAKRELLPTVQDSLLVHNLLFSWLSASAKYSDRFPIT